MTTSGGKPDPGTFEKQNELRLCFKTSLILPTLCAKFVTLASTLSNAAALALNYASALTMDFQLIRDQANNVTSR